MWFYDSSIPTITYLRHLCTWRPYAIFYSKLFSSICRSLQPINLQINSYQLKSLRSQSRLLSPTCIFHTKAWKTRLSVIGDWRAARPSLLRVSAPAQSSDARSLRGPITAPRPAACFTTHARPHISHVKPQKGFLRTGKTPPVISTHLPLYACTCKYAAFLCDGLT